MSCTETLCEAESPSSSPPSLCFSFLVISGRHSSSRNYDGRRIRDVLIEYDLRNPRIDEGDILL